MSAASHRLSDELFHVDIHSNSQTVASVRSSSMDRQNRSDSVHNGHDANGMQKSSNEPTTAMMHIQPADLKDGDLSQLADESESVTQTDSHEFPANQPELDENEQTDIVVMLRRQFFQLASSNHWIPSLSSASPSSSPSSLPSVYSSSLDSSPLWSLSFSQFVQLMKSSLQGFFENLDENEIEDQLHAMWKELDKVTVQAKIGVEERITFAQLIVLLKDESATLNSASALPASQTETDSDSTALSPQASPNRFNQSVDASPIPVVNPPIIPSNRVEPLESPLPILSRVSPTRFPPRPFTRHSASASVRSSARRPSLKDLRDLLPSPNGVQHTSHHSSTHTSGVRSARTSLDSVGNRSEHARSSSRVSMIAVPEHGKLTPNLQERDPDRNRNGSESLESTPLASALFSASPVGRRPPIIRSSSALVRNKAATLAAPLLSSDSMPRPSRASRRSAEEVNGAENDDLLWLLSTSTTSNSESAQQISLSMEQVYRAVRYVTRAALTTEEGARILQLLALKDVPAITLPLLQRVVAQLRQQINSNATADVTETPATVSAGSPLDPVHAFATAIGLSESEWHNFEAKLSNSNFTASESSSSISSSSSASSSASTLNSSNGTVNTHARLNLNPVAVNSASLHSSSLDVDSAAQGELIQSLHNENKKLQYKFSYLERMYKELDEKNNQLRSSLESVSQARSNVESDLAHVRAELADKCLQVDSLIQEKKNAIKVSDDREEIRKQLDLNEKELSQLREKRKSDAIELAKMQLEIDVFKEKLKEKELSERGKSVAWAKPGAQSELDKLKVEREELVEQVKALKAENESSSALLRELEGRNAEYMKLYEGEKERWNSARSRGKSMGVSADHMLGHMEKHHDRRFGRPNEQHSPDHARNTSLLAELNEVETPKVPALPAFVSRPALTIVPPSPTSASTAVAAAVAAAAGLTPNSAAAVAAAVVSGGVGVDGSSKRVDVNKDVLRIVPNTVAYVNQLKQLQNAIKQRDQQLEDLHKENVSLKTKNKDLQATVDSGTNVIIKEVKTHTSQLIMVHKKAQPSELPNSPRSTSIIQTAVAATASSPSASATPKGSVTFSLSSPQSPSKNDSEQTTARESISKTAVSSSR